MKRVVFSLNQRTWDDAGRPEVVERLRSLYDHEVVISDVPSGWTEPPKPDAAATDRLVEVARDADALVVSHGSPLVDGALLDQLPKVRFVGELEGDRFASRIDVAACSERGIPVVDTNNFCSYPVAEWALALTLMGLRNYGVLFRRAVIDRRSDRPPAWMSGPGYRNGELAEKTVGLLGFGHIGRHLRKLLAPFDARVYAYDPYVPRELGEALGVTLTTLDRVLSVSDVVVCLVPITPRTEGMLGAREFALMKEGAVFVNVSRGKVVDTAALLERAREEKVIACLDVSDPEPLPPDSPLRDVPSVILSPHIAGITDVGRARSLSLMLDELGRHFAGDETWYSILPHTLANRTGKPAAGESV